MKNLTLTKIYMSITAVLFATSFLFGCSEDSMLNSTSNSVSYQTDSPDSNVTVEPSWQGDWLVFKVTNNLPGIIVNDFHVQFDTAVKIVNVSTVQNWVVDPQTTDLEKGKIGVKGGQPIQPGQFMNAVGVKLKFTGPSKVKPSASWDFTWQATRDGVTVFEGHGDFPRR